MPEQHLESYVPIMSSIFVALAALRDSFCSDLSLARKVATVLAPTKRVNTWVEEGGGGTKEIRTFICERKCFNGQLL